MKTSLLLFLVVFQTACCNNPMAKKMLSDSLLLVGADSDDHGCKRSAGYLWSEVRGDCVRLWEVGVALHPIVVDSTATATMASYAIFAIDSSRVELFSDSVHEILVKKESLWSSNSRQLLSRDGIYIVFKDGAEVLRSQEN
ncbi:MAG: hypothetical protein RSA50_04315 [Mucinivorans sp.]